METDSRVAIENITIGFLLTTICICGIIGNIVTFVVLWYQHQHKRRLILNYFLLGLTVFDTIYLMTWLNYGIRYAHRLFGGEIPSKTYSVVLGAYLSLIFKPFGYVGRFLIIKYTFLFHRFTLNSKKFYYYFFALPGSVGSTIFIVTITIDRFLTVCHTNIAKIYWRKRTIVCTCVSVLIAVISLAFAIPSWLSYDVVEAANSTGYIVQRNDIGASSQLASYNLWLNTTVIMILPFPILVVLNTLIFKKVNFNLLS